MDGCARLANLPGCLLATSRDKTRQRQREGRGRAREREKQNGDRDRNGDATYGVTAAAGSCCLW